MGARAIRPGGRARHVARRARRRRRRAAKAARRHSDLFTRKRPRPGSTMFMTGRGSFLSAAAARRSIATASALPRFFWPGARIPPSCSSNKSTPGGPLRFEEKALTFDTGHHELEGILGAYPIRYRRRRPYGSVRAAGWGESATEGRSRTAPFRSPTRNGALTAIPVGRLPSRPNGRQDRIPTLAIGHYVDRHAPGSPWGTCEDNSLYRPQPGDKPDYSVRTPAPRPGFALCRCCSPIGTSRAFPSLRVSKRPQYYRGGEEQMWEDRGRQTAQLYGRADGWRHLSISAWA